MPKAVLAVPSVLERSELVPPAVLALPIVLANKDFDPIAVLEIPRAPGTGLFLPLLYNAESPIATKLVPSISNFNAPVPMAILLKPDVFASPACTPQKMFPVTGCNSPDWILFILKRRG